MHVQLIEQLASYTQSESHISALIFSLLQTSEWKDYKLYLASNKYQMKVYIHICSSVYFLPVGRVQLKACTWFYAKDREVLDFCLITVKKQVLFCERLLTIDH